MKPRNPKGALPVPYIVALIIAIIVIAVLIYWFLVLGGKGTDQATFRLCQGKVFTYCSQWAGCNYQDSCQPKDKTGNGADFFDLNPDCVPFRGSPNGLPSAINPTQCKAFFGQQTS